MKRVVSAAVLFTPGIGCGGVDNKQGPDAAVIDAAPAVGDASPIPGKTQADARASCQAIHMAGATTDGLYWLDPDGGDPANAFLAYCEMTTLGGGWTQVMNVNPADGDFVQKDAQWDRRECALEIGNDRTLGQATVGQSIEQLCNGNRFKLTPILLQDHDNFIIVHHQTSTGQTRRRPSRSTRAPRHSQPYLNSSTTSASSREPVTGSGRSAYSVTVSTSHFYPKTTTQPAFMAFCRKFRRKTALIMTSARALVLL